MNTKKKGIMNRRKSQGEKGYEQPKHLKDGFERAQGTKVFPTAKTPLTRTARVRHTTIDIAEKYRKKNGLRSIGDALDHMIEKYDKILNEEKKEELPR